MEQERFVRGKKTKSYYEEGFVAIEGFPPSFYFFYVDPFSLLLSFPLFLLVSLSFSSYALCVSQVSKNTNDNNKKLPLLPLLAKLQAWLAMLHW